MLTRKMMGEFIPEDGAYNGSARMLFRDPDGSISGKGTIRLSADGHVTARIDVEQYSIPPEYRNLLMAFLHGGNAEPTGGAGVKFRIGGVNKFGSLEITTAEGTFRASRALVGGGTFRPFADGDEWFEAVPYGLEFVLGDADNVATGAAFRLVTPLDRMSSLPIRINSTDGLRIVGKLQR